jgi:hypothetical protein
METQISQMADSSRQADGEGWVALRWILAEGSILMAQRYARISDDTVRREAAGISGGGRDT